MNPLDSITLDLLLSSLAPLERDSVLMWYIEDYSLKEIADILNEKYQLNGKKSLKARKVRDIIAKSMEKLRKNVKE